MITKKLEGYAVSIFQLALMTIKGQHSSANAKKALKKINKKQKNVRQETKSAESSRSQSLQQLEIIMVMGREVMVKESTK